MTYNTHNAKRRLLQLAVAALRIREASSGKAEVNLIEVVRGVDYVKFQHVLATQASREGRLLETHMVRFNTTVMKRTIRTTCNTQLMK